MDVKLLCILGLFVIFLYIVWKCNKKKESYRDPIYMNRQKLTKDWYPNTNGSIYGFPAIYGGSWNIFTGYPSYENVY